MVCISLCSPMSGKNTAGGTVCNMGRVYTCDPGVVLRVLNHACHVDGQRLVHMVLMDVFVCIVTQVTRRAR